MNKGKVALVTGAGSGVGRAVAIAMAKEGYSVVLAGRRIDALEDTVKLAAGLAGEVFPVAADLKDRASVTNLFAETVKRYGRLDVLFNNAGVGAPPIPLEELTFEQWTAVVDTNLSGVFYCTQEAFKIMKDQSPRGGRIINNGSVSAHAPRPNSAPYTATKHAVAGLTKATSLDGRKYDIACGEIDIGNAATSMTERMSGGVMQADGRMMPEPTMAVENVANAVVFMASLPLDANVQTITVMATKMPYIGRG